jgi:FkbM family methyltransferase
MPTIKTYLGRLQRRRHPLKFLLARLLWQSSAVSYVPLLIRRDRYTLRFFPSKLSADYWADPGQEREEELLLKTYLRPGDVVVDVGANIGTVTLTASALVGETGRVFAIEPQPRIFGFLEQNIALNGFSNIVPLNVAVSETEGVVTLSTGLLDTSNMVVAQGGQQVPARPLDAILEPHALARIDLLKIDVEGYEYDVLRSAPESLRKARCVYFEHIARYFGRYHHEESEIFDILLGAGLKLFRLRGDATNVLALRDVEEFRARVQQKLDLVPVS